MRLAILGHANFDSPAYAKSAAQRNVAEIHAELASQYEALAAHPKLRPKLRIIYADASAGASDDLNDDIIATGTAQAS